MAANRGGGGEGARAPPPPPPPSYISAASCGEIHREEIYHVCGRSAAAAVRQRCHQLSPPRGWSSSPLRYVMTMMTIIIISEI